MRGEPVYPDVLRPPPGAAEFRSEPRQEPEGHKNESEDDELMSRQKVKGYGEDEDKREKSLPQ